MAKEKANDNLTGKQELFVRHYLVSLNGVDAARKAGYQGEYATLGSVAYENLKKPQVKARISAAMDEMAMPPEEVIARLTRMGRGSLAPFLDTGDALKGEAPKFDLSTPDAKANLDLIKKLKTKTVTRIKEGSDGEGGEGLEVVEIELEIHDPKDATVHVGKYHKMFTDKVEHEGTIKVERSAAELTDDELDAIIAGRADPSG